VTERISKGACAWHGASRVDDILQKLVDDAPPAFAAAHAAGGRGADPASPGATSGDASSLKSLATRLMQCVGVVPGHEPVPFDACVSALKLGGVPAPDAPGATGTGALAGAARRLHDVSSILIRIGVIEYREPEGGGKGRGGAEYKLNPVDDPTVLATVLTTVLTTVVTPIA
jgi:hypothetical protein